MKTKKKIGFLLSVITERGGIGRVASLISNELNKLEDFDVHIISYARKQISGYNWSEDLSYHYLLESQIPMKIGIIKASNRLRSLVKHEKIDILICCGAIVGPLSVLGTCFTSSKLIYWSHSSFKGSSNKQFRIFNEYFTATFANSIVSLTKVDKANYKKHTLANQVFQIYNPVDNKLRVNNRPYNSTSSKIISVGRLTYQKNFEGLIDVAAIVLSKNNNISWDIYGSGEDEEKLRKKIKEKGLEGRVILKGQTNKLYDLYNDYTIMVMTSRYEGFPMSLIEGLACQLPLISYDIPTGPNEIIRHGKNGYLIAPFNIDQMACKILYLIENPQVRVAFSNNNSKLIEEYNLDNIVKRWCELLNE